MHESITKKHFDKMLFILMKILQLTPEFALEIILKFGQAIASNVDDSEKIVGLSLETYIPIASIIGLMA